MQQPMSTQAGASMLAPHQINPPRAFSNENKNRTKRWFLAHLISKSRICFLPVLSGSEAERHSHYS
mgnify:CR=1 FL=1